MGNSNLEKFYELKEKTNKLKKFGYEFNNCLSEKKIRKFEKKFKIKLPEDYRNYLKIIGNGGDGSYGINKLENAYPLTLYYDDYFDKRTGFRKVKRNFLYSENIERNAEIFRNLYHCKSAKKHNSYQGSLVLVDYGCNNYYFMEVTGKNPGRIWFDSMASTSEIYPIYESFYDLFNEWVNEALKIKEFYQGVQNEDINLIKCNINENNINSTMINYETFPIYIALKKGNLKVIKVLLELGADLNLRTFINGPWYNSVIEFMVRKITEYGYSKDELNNDLEIIKLLFEYGAELNIKGDWDRGTPLDIAKRSNQNELKNLLINLGAKSENEIKN